MRVLTLIPGIFWDHFEMCIDLIFETLNQVNQLVYKAQGVDAITDTAHILTVEKEPNKQL